MRFDGSIVHRHQEQIASLPLVKHSDFHGRAPARVIFAISAAPDPRDKAWRFHRRLDYQGNPDHLYSRASGVVCVFAHSRGRTETATLAIPRGWQEKPVRAIIDKSVLSALTYYSTYLTEPSPPAT